MYYHIFTTALHLAVLSQGAAVYQKGIGSEPLSVHNRTSVPRNNTQMHTVHRLNNQHTVETLGRSSFHPSMISHHHLATSHPHRPTRTHTKRAPNADPTPPPT